MKLFTLFGNPKLSKWKDVAANSDVKLIESFAKLSWLLLLRGFCFLFPNCNFWCEFYIKYFSFPIHYNWIITHNCVQQFKFWKGRFICCSHQMCKTRKVNQIFCFKVSKNIFKRQKKWLRPLWKCTFRKSRNTSHCRRNINMNSFRFGTNFHRMQGSDSVSSRIVPPRYVPNTQSRKSGHCKQSPKNRRDYTMIFFRSNGTMKRFNCSRNIHSLNSDCCRYVEDWQSIDNKSQFFVWQKGIKANERYHW